MKETLKRWLIVAVGSVGSIVGAIGAITTYGLAEAAIKTAKDSKTKTEEKSD